MAETTVCFRTPRNAHSFFEEDFQSDALYWSVVLFTVIYQNQFSSQLKRCSGVSIKKSIVSLGHACTCTYRLSKMYPCKLAIQSLHVFVHLLISVVSIKNIMIQHMKLLDIFRETGYFLYVLVNDMSAAG